MISNLRTPGKRRRFYFASMATFLLCRDNSNFLVDKAEVNEIK